MIIISPVINLELPGKVLEGIKPVGSIEPFIILTVAAFHFAVMPGCKRPNQFVPDSLLLQDPLKSSRRSLSGSRKALCEF